MRAFRIPSALMVVASLALLGCGDIAGPSVEAPQFRKNNDQGEQQPCVINPETTVCPDDEGDQGDDNEDNNENGG